MFQCLAKFASSPSPRGRLPQISIEHVNGTTFGWDFKDFEEPWPNGFCVNMLSKATTHERRAMTMTMKPKLGMAPGSRFI